MNELIALEFERSFGWRRPWIRFHVKGRSFGQQSRVSHSAGNTGIQELVLDSLNSCTSNPLLLLICKKKKKM